MAVFHKKRGKMPNKPLLATTVNDPPPQGRKETPRTTPRIQKLSATGLRELGSENWLEFIIRKIR